MTVKRDYATTPQCERGTGGRVFDVQPPQPFTRVHGLTLAVLVFVSVPVVYLVLEIIQ